MKEFKISNDITVQYMPKSDAAPKHILIREGSVYIVLWRSDEILNLAFKLQSLASKFKS